MRTLVLVRHAKSDWGDPQLTDHDRALNSRGLRDAPEMAKRLLNAGIAIDHILSSTALRARTTAAVFVSTLEQSQPVTIELHPELYLATAQTLKSRAASSGAQRLLIVAHDPGLSDLSAELSGGEIRHMPTCAVAVFTWESLDPDREWVAPSSWSFDSPRGGSFASQK